jgi:hypothetical protein
MPINFEGDYSSPITAHNKPRQTVFNSKYKALRDPNEKRGYRRSLFYASHPDFYIDEERKETIRELVRMVNTYPFKSKTWIGESAGVTQPTVVLYTQTYYFKSLMKERTDKLIKECREDLRLHAQEAVKEVDVNELHRGTARHNAR